VSGDDVSADRPATEGGTDAAGPSIVEEELDRRARDARVAKNIFLFIGSAVGTMSLIYLLTEDDAGQMMLGVTSLLGLWCGIFLWRNRQGAPTTLDAHRDDADQLQYLPHASVWPFCIGLAAFFLTNGLILGTWFLVPGAVLLVAGVIGFVRQSRFRT
jgi:uncharacterized membrane protein YfcA